MDPAPSCILRRAGLAALVAFTLLASLHAQFPGDPFRSSLDPLIEQGVREGRLAGFAAGVVLDGRLVYSRGVGLMNVSRPDSAVTPDTLFHMASITKPFVATAVMQLVEQGKVDLDAKVTRYLPYFKTADARSDAITVRQLLTHTSGMPDVDDYEWNKPQYDDGALERYVRSLTGQKLRFDPGTRWAYSNMGFEVLGDLVAKVSGTSVEECVQRRILEPLGMVSSTLLVTRADRARLADGYSRPRNDTSGPLVMVPAYPYNRIHTPSSDLHSSVNDMARWALANLNRGELDGRRILKAATYDTLWKPAAEIEFCRGEDMTDCRKPGGSVGISWFLEQKGGHLVVSHGGGDDGFVTSLILVPDRKMAFVAMANADRPAARLMQSVQAEALRVALANDAKK